MNRAGTVTADDNRDFIFYLECPESDRVFVVLSLNGGARRIVELRQTVPSIWHARLPLAPGRYQYRYYRQIGQTLIYESPDSAACHVPMPDTRVPRAGRDDRAGVEPAVAGAPGTVAPAAGLDDSGLYGSVGPATRRERDPIHAADPAAPKPRRKVRYPSVITPPPWTIHQKI